MKNIIVSELLRGFHKLTFEKGGVEYINPSKLEALKKDKEVKLIFSGEKKASKKVDDTPKDPTADLMKLSRDDLLELAKRSGFVEADFVEAEGKDATKKDLVDFINSKNSKSE